MAIVDLVQRSEAWFAWRKTGITASMIPVIMGLSPYQTAYQLWAELVGYKKPDDLSNNYHVQRGVAQEPEARDVVENEYGRPYMPVCVMADHNSLFLASLDGLYSSGTEREVLEIKCPCEKIYQEILAMKGRAPTFQMYAAQVQWQLNAASAKVGRLYFYLRGFRPISTEIKRNDAFIAQAEEKAIWFWNLVQTKTPPPMIEGRDKVVYDTPISNVDPTWLKRVEQLKEKNKRLVEMEKHIKAVKADIKQLEQYFTGQIPEEAKTFEKDGIRATRVERNGSVDYQQLLESIKSEMNIVIPESMIEKCRKEGTSYFKVTVSDNSTDSVSTQEKSETPEVEENTTVQNKPQELVKTAQVLTPKQLDSSELGYQPASKVTTQEEVKSTPSGEMVFPIPASNFFEKSNQSVFF